MKLGATPEDRAIVYRNLERECGGTREQRAAMNAKRRMLYLVGSELGQQVLYQSIHEYVEDSTSNLYAPDGARFGPVLPTKYGDEFLEKLAALKGWVHRVWHDTGPTLVYDTGVEWAHVYGCSVFKNITSDRDPVLALLPDPSDFGVWNEKGDLATQEALCHWYDMPIARFERLVAGYPAARRDAMLSAAHEYEGPPRNSAATGLGPAVSKIIITSASAATVAGAVTTMPFVSASMAVVREPCVPIAELWVRDDRLDCYRKVSLFPPTSDVLWDDPQHENYGAAHPFHLLTLEDIPGYLWGNPTIDRIVPLHIWENARWNDVDFFVQLQMKPPYFLRGIQGRDGEKADRVRTPGGEISSNDPTAEVKSLAPPAALLPDVFALIDGIQKMRRRVSGTPAGTSGEGQPNIRNAEQTATTTRLGASPLRRKASRVEACAGDIATQMVRMAQRREDAELITATGEKFLMAQVPDEVTVRVAAHSASPLYADSVRGLAFALHKAGAISLPELVEMADPPNADQLVPIARRMEKAKADHAKEALELEKTKVQAKKTTAEAAMERAEATTGR